ncbi:MAG: M23 family metallopeptidase [Pseudomonadota bacterium]
MRSALKGAALAALFVSTAQAQQQPFLSQPIDCKLGETCFLQALFDHDPSTDSQDFSCGSLTRDGHDGTDFALPNLAAMRAGVDVLAAAPGTVIGTRDRHADIMATDPAANFGDELCGNGVAISHGGGWVTQYCHLKRGSIAVEEGQRVATGTPLGEVGLSGSTTFPHLHLSLFRGGEDVDPFAPTYETCGAPTKTLWTDPLPLQEAGFYRYGFATNVPSFEAIKDDLPTETTLSATAPIVAWVSGFGSRPGDILDIEITHPSGTFHENTVTLEKRQETWQRFSGRNHTTQDWPSGTYTARLTLKRGGNTLDEATFTATLP